MNVATTSGGLSFWNLSHDPCSWAMEPGAMLLTSMPSLASASAVCLVAPISAALEDMYEMLPPRLTPPNRGDVDYSAPTLLLHVGYYSFHKLEPAEHIQVKCRLEILQGCASDVVARTSATGVVHQDVHLAKAVDRFPVKVVHAFDVRHIGLNSNGLDPQGVQLSDCLVQRASCPATNGDIYAFSCQ